VLEYGRIVTAMDAVEIFIVPLPASAIIALRE
jgi:hypothetical protein